MDVWIMLGLGIKLMQGVAECCALLIQEGEDACPPHQVAQCFKVMILSFSFSFHVVRNITSVVWFCCYVKCAREF